MIALHHKYGDTFALRGVRMGVEWQEVLAWAGGDHGRSRLPAPRPWRRATASQECDVVIRAVRGAQGAGLFVRGRASEDLRHAAGWISVR